MSASLVKPQPKSDRTQAQEILAAAVESGGKILVAGEHAFDLIPQALRAHSRLIIWDDARQQLDNKTIPKRVHVILWTRFVSHKITIRLNEFANRHKRTIFGQVTPTELRAWLNHALIHEKPEAHVELEAAARVNVGAEKPSSPRSYECVIAEYASSF